MPDSNPGTAGFQSGALPLSHHIPNIEPPHPHFHSYSIFILTVFSYLQYFAFFFLVDTAADRERAESDEPRDL